jgi:hypothetical protein
MRASLERRRVLLAAADRDRAILRGLLTDGPGMAWEVSEADSFEQARFLAQMDACDILLLDASLDDLTDAGGAAWLATRLEASVVYLAEPTPAVLRGAVQTGSFAWLPRGLALGNPLLLHATIHQAARAAQLQRELACARESLWECRERVDRLVGRLWECAPGEGNRHWFSQRHMMDRLQEEVIRAQRHGGPLAIVLADAAAAGAEGWTTVLTDLVSRCKRRCDVAGQYGPAGFMLILPRTGDAGAVGCCARLQKLLEKPPPVLDRPAAGLRAHFGIASFGTSSATATVKGLLRLAEERLEQAKTGAAGPIAS